MNAEQADSIRQYVIHRAHEDRALAGRAGDALSSDGASDGPDGHGTRSTLISPSG